MSNLTPIQQDATRLVIIIPIGNQKPLSLDGLEAYILI